MKLTRRQVIASIGFALGGATITKLGAAESTARESRHAQPTRAGSGKALPVCLADFEALAKKRLSHFAYEYIASGAADELTIRWNREAFDQIRLRPKVLVNVENVDTSVTLFGQEMPHPILLAPIARHRLSHREGEVATARGADAAGATFVVASLS